MAGAGNNAHVLGGEAGHSLCPLESCEEGELCPHAVHMALRMEDGIGGDALNARAGCHSADGAARTQVAEGGEPPREGGRGCRRLANCLESRQRDSHLGGEENSSDPTMIGYNHSSHKIVSTALVSDISTGAVGPNGVQSAPCWCHSQVMLGSRRVVAPGWSGQRDSVMPARCDSARRREPLGAQLYWRKNRRRRRDGRGRSVWKDGQQCSNGYSTTRPIPSMGW